MTASPRRRSPRGSLVLDTRDLSRRPGSMKRASVRAQAPSALGTSMLGVPEGAPITVDVRLEAVMEGVLVSGEAVMPVRGECARCLDEIDDTVRADIQELFYYPGRASELEDDEDVPELVDDHIDIEPALRDALVLSLPLSPYCRPDCPGLCDRCGARLDEVGPGHTHSEADPRWAALSALTAARPSSGPDPGGAS